MSKVIVATKEFMHITKTKVDYYADGSCSKPIFSGGFTKETMKLHQQKQTKPTAQKTIIEEGVEYL